MRRIFCLLILMMSISDSAFCYCLGTGKSFQERLRDEFASAKVVFIGKVVSQNIVNTAPAPSYCLDVSFEVSKLYKGINERFIVVQTGWGCGDYRGYIDFEDNEEYVIFAFLLKDGTFYVDECSPNQKLTHLKEENLKLLDTLSRSGTVIKKEIKNSNEH